MQTEIQTKVKISVSEIKKILAEKFCLYHDFELEIVGDSLPESKSVNEENNEWIDVPKDWNKPCCPTELGEDVVIEVQFRNGKSRSNNFVSLFQLEWIQEDHDWDIVRYRVSKQQSN